MRVGTAVLTGVLVGHEILCIYWWAPACLLESEVKLKYLRSICLQILRLISADKSFTCPSRGRRLRQGKRANRRGDDIHSVVQGTITVSADAY